MALPIAERTRRRSTTEEREKCDIVKIKVTEVKTNRDSSTSDCLRFRPLPEDGEAIGGGEGDNGEEAAPRQCASIDTTPRVSTALIGYKCYKC